MPLQINKNRLSFILFGFTFLVFLASYCFLSHVHRKWNVFPVIVHENGKYTLLQTIFYFDHVLREMPIAILMSLSLAIAFYLHSPLTKSKMEPVAKRIYRNSFLLTIFLTVTVIAAAIYQNGVRSAALDLFQFRTRDELLEYGSHWHFHLLHTVYFFVASLAVVQICRRLAPPWLEMNPHGKSLLVYWILFFTGLTVLFVPSLLPFSDARYLAHQMREIVTHSLTTLPLALATMLFYENRLDESVRPDLKTGTLRWGNYLLPIVVAIPLFIFHRLSGVDILSIAQKKTGMGALLAFHFFEHLIDSILVASLSLFLYLFLIRKAPVGSVFHGK